MDCSMSSLPMSWSLLKFMSIELKMLSKISCSAITFSFYLQSFPASGSFPVSWLFALGGQNIGASVPVSVLTMNSQSWFPLGLTAWISLLSKGLSRVSSSTTVWKHQFWDTQPSLWSNSPIYTWLLENHRYLLPKWCLCFLYAVYICHSFPSKKQESLNFMVKII